VDLRETRLETRGCVGKPSNTVSVLKWKPKRRHQERITQNNSMICICILSCSSVDF